MATRASNDDEDVHTLESLMDLSIKITDELENSKLSSNNPEYQKSVKKGILMLEDGTRLVSSLDLFSYNENISEIPSEHLKYFLLPFLLGNLHYRLLSENRLEQLQIVIVYYEDFLQRLIDYEALEEKIEIPRQIISSDSQKDLETLNRERENKIRRLCRSKELEGEMKDILKILDDSTLREYSLKRLQHSVILALETLEMIHKEMEILKFMSSRHKEKQTMTEQPSQKLTPIIITKDAMQKKVFGMGYPALPVLSIEEFYEGRVRDGIFPKPSKNSLFEKAKNPEEDKEGEEKENKNKDEKEDRDDEESLLRARSMDEWKDDHRRGEGNRYNRS